MDLSCLFWNAASCRFSLLHPTNKRIKRINFIWNEQKNCQENRKTPGPYSNIDSDNFHFITHLNMNTKSRSHSKFVFGRRLFLIYLCDIWLLLLALRDRTTFRLFIVIFLTFLCSRFLSTNFNRSYEECACISGVKRRTIFVYKCDNVMPEFMISKKVIYITSPVRSDIRPFSSPNANKLKISKYSIDRKGGGERNSKRAGRKRKGDRRGELKIWKRWREIQLRAKSS